MINEPITPHGTITDCYGDEFEQGRLYRNWRPNGSNDFLLIHTLAGCGAIGLPPHEYATRPGESVLFETGAAQRYATDPATGRWHLVWNHFQPRPDWREWLDWPQLHVGVRHLQLAPNDLPAYVEALRQANRHSRSATFLNRPLAMNALERCLIHAARSAHLRGSRQDPRIEKAREWLVTPVDGQWPTLETVARQCGLSLSRFAHLFREKTGLSPHAYAQQARLRRAARLLTMTNLSITEIATECGFESPFYFTNRFRRLYRMPPSRYRQEAVGG